MVISGYIAAILIGILLGLIGSGGSILTMPVLVYLFNISPKLATVYSLFTVGLSASVGAMGYFRLKLLNYKAVLNFGVPSLVAVFITRKYLFPLIPDVLIQHPVVITKNTGIMLFFSMLMLASSYFLIRQPKEAELEIDKNEFGPLQKIRHLMTPLGGLFVGCTVALVGAGGGFLIIPALIIFAELPMKMAVGTSLLIIALNSLIGFAGDVQNDIQINWLFLSCFTVLSMGGMAGGVYLARYISGARLKPVLGCFILVMGILIIARELSK